MQKLSLELGGKSPNIVFADCDLEAAVGGTMSAIFMNQGQMCTAGSRLLLEEGIYDKFMKLLIEKTKKLKIGNALDYQTEFGPVISKEQREKALEYIKEAVKQGTTVACGGKIPKDDELKKGFFLEPTILENVTNDMNVAREEIFGPVLCVIKFSGIEEAVRIARLADLAVRDAGVAQRRRKRRQRGVLPDEQRLQAIDRDGAMREVRPDQPVHDLHPARLVELHDLEQRFDPELQVG